MNGEIPVKLNSNEIFSELRRDYTKIFNELYGSGAGTSKKVLKRHFSFGKDEIKPSKYYDENHYRSREVWVGGYPTKESVFSCLTRDRHTKRIKQYFVSNLYNVNKQLSSFFAISGCFIFTLDERDDLVIHALAEEPAKEQLVFHSVERMYAFKRKSLRPGRFV